MVDAEKKAAEILREAGEKADKIRQQREEQSRAKVKSYEERTASAADMKKRTAVLAAKQELIGNVIADACDRVKNLDEEKYFGILKNMAEKYLLPREGEICFSKKDLEFQSTRRSATVSFNASVSVGRATFAPA